MFAGAIAGWAAVLLPFPYVFVGAVTVAAIFSLSSASVLLLSSGWVPASTALRCANVVVIVVDFYNSDLFSKVYVRVLE
ncbi:hypothetical protein BVRB_002840 [Beta vulgaris subsp. vulgaris]|uniref:Uncharacterized protein n=1 Tax=Beta vulgaris subsp. vulgaris TaxID=3555 RepID=A0A0J8DYT8_BETVV|nr:hypothetical protein BVRB_002840 [Beta vulgaris subsp. vulgaris]